MKLKYHNCCKKQCTIYSKAKKELGVIVADKLFSVLNFMESAPTLMDVKNMPMYHLHSLQGKRSGQFAIDLGRKLGWRLIIIPLDKNEVPMGANDANMIYGVTEVILVKEVSNHYE
jgi:proteic killer suppression protein